VEPDGGAGALHARDEGLGRVAAKGLDDDIACLHLAVGVEGGQAFGLIPGAQLEGRGTLAGRGHPGQSAGVVHPQAHTLAAPGQVGAQAPAHADVAEIVDDPTENVPLHAGDYPDLSATIEPMSEISDPDNPTPEPDANAKAAPTAAELQGRRERLLQEVGALPHL